MPDMFRSCSGQSYFTRRRNPSAPDWGICLSDGLYRSCPWWRAEDKAGRMCRFHTFEEAERYRLKLESLIAPHAGDIAARQRDLAQGGGDVARNAFGDAITAALRGKD